MKTYLVGGAVRDELLGLPVTERDYVVVGATPEEMLANKFRPVGKEFPVFLHPETKEEYALARTERKVGKGYKGFTFYAEKDVTLEEDLKRRDLTINAMAKTEEGKIIDPYGGRQDLKEKILRHVSLAFAEDPVRILRVARFAARFGDFQIHSDTLALMKKMVVEGEVDALVAERVWQEFEKALKESFPERFFMMLDDCGAAQKLFPEIKIPHAVSILSRATKLTKDSAIRFAALFANADTKAVKKLCERYRIPGEYQELALLAANHYSNYLSVSKEDAGAILSTLKMLDAFRRPERFEKFLLTCEINAGNKKASNILHLCYQAAAKISMNVLKESGLTGKAIGEAIDQLRIEEIKNIL